jgi:glutamate dehydrogenase
VLRQLGSDLDIERAVSWLRPGIQELMRDLPELIDGEEVARYDAALARFAKDGVPPRLARRVASLGAMHAGVDIVEVAHQRRAPIGYAARIYFGLGSALGLDWIRGEIERLAVDGHWQAVARGTLREDAYALHRRLTEQVVARSRRGDPAARVANWLEAGGAAVDNLARTVGAMRTGGVVDFPTLSVALQAVRRLTER